MEKIMKRIPAALLALGIAFVLPFSVPAASAEGNVSFDGEKIITDYSQEDVAKAFSGLVPGDDVTFTVHMKNDDKNSTDWYVKDEVFRSFEDETSAANGAYSFELTYTDPNGKPETLFSSSSIGGDSVSGSAKGLHQADSATEDYYYLGRLRKGETAEFALRIVLDGESQTNTYESTKAGLTIEFAVEKNETTVTPTPTTTPTGSPTKTVTPTRTVTPSRNSGAKTWDSSDTALYAALFFGAGLAVILLRKYRKRGE